MMEDDSAFLVSGKDKLQVEKALSFELGKICTWLTDDGKLSLHLVKTGSILFGSSFNLGKVDDFRVKVGDNVITRKDEIT